MSSSSPLTQSTSHRTPLLHSLFTEIILSSPASPLPSLSKFLQVLKWVLNGDIEKGDFSVLYAMWVRSGQQQQMNGTTHNSSPSPLGTPSHPVISFSQFCYALRDWSHEQLDITLGILTQECNENILRLNVANGAESQQSSFASNPKLTKHASLCTPSWLQSLERLFLLLDTNSLGYWDLDRIILFLMALLHETDKSAIARDVSSPAPLLLRTKEFMDSVPVYNGLLTLKSFKLFFLENGLSQSTVESTTRCLHEEVALYNALCGDAQLSTSHDAIVNHDFMWKQVCENVLRRHTRNALPTQTRSKLQNYLQFESDATRYAHITNLFSEKHAEALTNDFLQKLDAGNDTPQQHAAYQSVYQIMVSILLLYKRVVNRVLKVSAGVDGVDGGLLMEDDVQDGDRLDRSVYIGESPISQQQQPSQDVPRSSAASQSSSRRHTAPPPQQQQPASQHRTSSHHHTAASIYDQPTEHSQHHSPHNTTSHHHHHSHNHSQIYAADAPLSSVPSVSSGRSRPSTAQQRHKTSRYSPHHSQRSAKDDEISELSSLDDDLTIVKLPFNMEKRIRNAEWRDIKFDNCEKFQYLPVRTGPVVPEWHKDHGPIAHSENVSVRGGPEEYDDYERPRGRHSRSMSQRSEYSDVYARRRNGEMARGDAQQYPRDDASYAHELQSQRGNLAFSSHLQPSNLDALEREIIQSAMSMSGDGDSVPPWVPHVAKRIIAELIDKSKNGGAVAAEDARTQSNRTSQNSSPNRPPTVHVKSDEFQKMLKPEQQQQHSDADPTVTPHEKREPHIDPEALPEKPQRIEQPSAQSETRPTTKSSFFSRKKRPNPQKSKSFSLLRSPRGKKTNPPEETQPPQPKPDALITAQKEPSPERELFDHLSLDDDTQEEIQFDADITPASLKHMLALTRSGKNNIRSAGRSSAPLMRGGSPLHRASTMGTLPRGGGAGLSSTQPVSMHTSAANVSSPQGDDKRVVQPIALNQVPRKRDARGTGFTSGYPGLQGEEKEVQLPSLPKSYYKRLKQNRMEKSPQEHSASMSQMPRAQSREKRMWRI